jgi:hypothetical protein
LIASTRPLYVAFGTTTWPMRIDSPYILGIEPPSQFAEHLLGGYDLLL